MAPHSTVIISVDSNPNFSSIQSKIDFMKSLNLGYMPKSDSNIVSKHRALIKECSVVIKRIKWDACKDKINADVPVGPVKGKEKLIHSCGKNLDENLSMNNDNTTDFSETNSNVPATNEENASKVMKRRCSKNLKVVIKIGNNNIVSNLICKKKYVDKERIGNKKRKSNDFNFDENSNELSDDEYKKSRNFARRQKWAKYLVEFAAKQGLQTESDFEDETSDVASDLNQTETIDRTNETDFITEKTTECHTHTSTSKACDVEVITIEDDISDDDDCVIILDNPNNIDQEVENRQNYSHASKTSDVINNCNGDSMCDGINQKSQTSFNNFDAATKQHSPTKRQKSTYFQNNETSEIEKENYNPEGAVVKFSQLPSSLRRLISS